MELVGNHWNQLKSDTFINCHTNMKNSHTFFKRNPVYTPILPQISICNTHYYRFFLQRLICFFVVQKMRISLFCLIIGKISLAQYSWVFCLRATGVLTLVTWYTYRRHIIGLEVTTITLLSHRQLSVYHDTKSNGTYTIHNKSIKRKIYLPTSIDIFI